MPKHFTLTFADEKGRRRRVAVDKSRFRVGRGEENDLRLGIAGLSRRHALLEVLGDRLYLSDNGSSNGTTINGQRVEDAVEVCDGDVIVLGDVCMLRVSNVGAKGADAAHEEPDAPATEAPNVPPPAAPAPPAAKPSPFGPHVIVGGLVGLLLLAGVVLLALYLGGAGQSASADDSPLAVEEETGNSNPEVKAGAKSDDVGTATVKAADAPVQTAVTTQPSVNTQPSVTTQSTDIASVRSKTGGAGGEPERDAVRRVMARISNHDYPYISDAGARAGGGQGEGGGGGGRGGRA